jgi:cyclopropane fatty-acyl-phospholipid synthase-like methyltransferase
MGLGNRFFDLQYLLGRIPWDTGITPPEVVALVEGGSLPPGRALDLGCGTGTNCIYLARHGWETVGVDFSAVAIRRAQRKARRARMDCEFHHADVTDLLFLQPPFTLALDIGCLQGVPQERWGRYAQGLMRLVQPGGVYMLYAFTPRPERSTPWGMSPEEVRRLFTPAFILERQEGGNDPTGPRSAWYWLQRTDLTGNT